MPWEVMDRNMGGTCLADHIGKGLLYTTAYLRDYYETKNIFFILFEPLDFASLIQQFSQILKSVICTRADCP